MPVLVGRRRRWVMLDIVPLATVAAAAAVAASRLLLLGAKPVVVSGVPMWIHLHVLLSFDSGLLVILGLFLTT